MASVMFFSSNQYNFAGILAILINDIDIETFLSGFI